MKQVSYKLVIALAIIFIMVNGCDKKKDFLDVSPGTHLAEPSTLENVQAILDNDAILNRTFLLGEWQADDYYLAPSFWDHQDLPVKNAYIWAKDIFEGRGTSEDWNQLYKQVFYCNVALEALTKITVTPGQENDWNAARGDALFKRSLAFYNLAQLFARPYDEGTAGIDAGIPLRLRSDVGETSVRGTVKQTYEQLQNDLLLAETLLPANVPPVYRNRGSKPAAQALLARIYLSMRDYSKAGKYAGSCLQTNNTLLDYNQVNGNDLYPFSRTSPEVLFQSILDSKILVARFSDSCIINNDLYGMYKTGDLRKELYFGPGLSTGLPVFKNSYSGLIFLFSGLAVDELFLVKAECLAKENKTAEALDWLNRLLEKRYRSGSFTPEAADSPETLLQLIRDERRKELVFRSCRWADLRRYNKEGANITLSRNLGGTVFYLPPNDNRYVLPIPPDVIRLSGMIQNPR